MNNKLSILYPSRSRPGKAYSTFQKWFKSAKYPHEYILSLDTDEPYMEDYNSLFSTLPVKIITNDNTSLIGAVNNAAKVATNDIFIVISDDFECFPNWDQAIIDATLNKKDFCLKTNDGNNQWILTLPIMDREFYNRFGFIYNPIYSHMFVDTEQSSVAHYLNKIIYANYLLFEHKHPDVGKAVSDDLNKRNNLSWTQGQETYLKRYYEDFGLNENEIINYFTPRSHPEHCSWMVQVGVRNI